MAQGKQSHKGRALLNYLATRNWRPHPRLNIADVARNHPPFLYRLNLMKKLRVHDGCVNTVCWNKTGEYILTGSDDCNLCITKPTYMFDTSKDYTVLHKVQTRHLGNIFSAQFIPNTGDTLIASCSSEGPVIVHDINSHDPSEGVLNFNCHSSTIYEVVTVPDDDKIFLTCSEDKTVRLFDMRVHSSCARAGTCPHPSLIRNSSAMTTLNLHPLNTNLMLVGRADGIGLVYDRRKLPDVSKFSRAKAHQERLAALSGRGESSTFKYMHPLDGVISQFTVPDIDDKYRFTSLCYNKNGSEVLASYSGDYVYLFDHDKSSNVELIKTLPRVPESKDDSGNRNANTNTEEHCSRTATNEHGRPRSSRISRIRVRGDWSDTGVNSVPHSRMRRADDTNSSAQPTSFFQHMADIANGLRSRRMGGERQTFVPVTGLSVGPVRYNSSSPSSSSTSSSTPNSMSSSGPEQTQNTQINPRQAYDRIVEEEENNDEDHDDDDDVGDDDDDSTVVDEEEEDGDLNDEDEVSFERYADMTVEGLMNAATERVHQVITSESDVNSRTNSDSNSSNGVSNNNSESNRPRVSNSTKMKFKRTLDDLKSRFNSIPTYHPRVKYQGHRNSRTSIKEAIFWGDSYVMSGSDCGRIMVWEKETARLVMGFPADDRVVNCLAPNPHNYVLASSGIDYDVKLWSTQSLLEGPLRISEEEMDEIVRNNEIMLEESKETISVPPHLFFRVLASLADMNHGHSAAASR